MNKKVIMVIFTTIFMILTSIHCSVINNKNDELETYKRYYNASEKLFDEIEEDNEAYFDTDRGADYLHIRKEIQQMNK